MPFDEFPASKEAGRVHFNPELAGPSAFFPPLRCAGQTRLHRRDGTAAEGLPGRKSDCQRRSPKRGMKMGQTPHSIR